MIDLDNSEVRDALFERITDQDAETRGEAYLGLARRKDKRAIEPLRKEILSKNRGKLFLEAVEKFGLNYPPHKPNPTGRKS